MKAILVRDLENKVVVLKRDIATEANVKLRNRLTEEQAAYKIVLRNLKQHEVQMKSTRVVATPVPTGKE